MNNQNDCWQSQKAGSCWQISFAPMSEYPADLSEFLEEYFNVVSCNYQDDGQEQYIAYQNAAFDETDFIKAAKTGGIELPAYDISFLESQNWLKDYVIEFAPVEVEDFLIYGIHEKEAPKTDKLALKIYAATAFGSSHQTTQSCLRAISWLNKHTDINRPDAGFKGPRKINILDIGTGSGILSLAAAKLWPESKITAVDIDEEAVWVTRQNALDNNLQNQFTVEVSDGYHSDLVKNNAPYDAIFANILARPLIEMAPDLYQNLKTGGFCILSGFVDDQVDWVLGEHQKQGLKLVKLFELDNWRAAVMEK